MNSFRVLISCVILGSCLPNSFVAAAEFIGTIVDSQSSQPIASRVYLQDSDDNWMFVESATKDGSALPYREQWVPMLDSVEKHTTVSSHGFKIDLQPGSYRLTIERGKEYFPLTTTIKIDSQPQRRTFRLKRWIDMAARGWFSGETHVHRRIAELPNVMLAEDLNVAFPVTFWTINASETPGLSPSPLRRQGPSPFGSREDRGYRMIEVDSTHVVFPRNTEYEIFSINGKRHTLGAVFILNHKTAFKEGMPPVTKIAEQAHREGALLDLDKHSWPWAMMLVPVAKIDLFELSNNSVWRTKFGFRRSVVQPAAYMDVEADAGAMTEWGWLNFGFENYYTLLNCGFRLQPTAGTASGVHPVPLGYSRVYVHTGDSFDSQRWLEGLRRGRSFVSTGPMLFTTVDNARQGEVFKQNSAARDYSVQITSVSARPIERIEVIVNGEIAKTFRPESNTPAKTGGFTSRHKMSLKIDRSSWIVVRSIEIQPDKRVRFAHTAPWHIEVAQQPIRPRREEVEFLIRRVRNELQRSEKLLPDEAVTEFRKALAIYEGLRERAIDRPKRR